ncbi:MAG: pro-sigmaK processing inhibitor BofA family protein, partial [Ruminococcus sp.]|nr:pro-sigmaK processing inhibitor BofA family protein [Ruminococcus sp.]
AALVLVDALSVFTGVYIPVSLLSIIVSLVGGVPGVTTLLALNLFFERLFLTSSRHSLTIFLFLVIVPIIILYTSSGFLWKFFFIILACFTSGA